MTKEVANLIREATRVADYLEQLTPRYHRADNLSPRRHKFAPELQALAPPLRKAAQEAQEAEAKK